MPIGAFKCTDRCSSIKDCCVDDRNSACCVPLTLYNLKNLASTFKKTLQLLYISPDTNIKYNIFTRVRAKNEKVRKTNQSLSVPLAQQSVNGTQQSTVTITITSTTIPY